MTTHSWSLANRLTWWVSLVTTVPLALAFLLGGHFLHRSVAMDLDSLVREELQEAMAYLQGEEDPVGAFGPISQELSARHPTTPAAWRLFDADSGAVLADFGQAAIFSDGQIPSAKAIGEVAELGDGLLSKTVPISEQVNLGIVLDGRSQLRLLDRYWAVAGGTLALGIFVSLLASRVLVRKATALLRGVADSVKIEADGSSDTPALRSAPDEIRAVADTLRTNYRRLWDEAERIKLFTAGLAHELRSPIQNLMGEVEVALMSDDDPSSYRPLLVSQLEELSDLGDAVDNLLTICTIESSEETAREVFDLADEARLRLTREQSRRKADGIRVEIEASGDTRMSGDREHVLRGLRNVVANAIDWSPQQGCVRVSLEGRDEVIAITVDDDGPGIPEEDRERVFEAFVRGNRRGRARIGYGLGLAIAKAAVESHQGRICIASSPSGGARFSMSFGRGQAR